MLTKDEEKHPAYGMVGISRCTGAKKLFGSHLDEHHQFIALRIRRAARSHDLSMDWYRGTEELIEVHLSAAQFADLLIGMNVGDGVPCTISFIKSEGRMPPIPEEEKTEVQRAKEGFKEAIEDLRKKLRAGEVQAAALLQKKSLTKEDRKQLLDIVLAAGRFFWDQSPFVMDQFVESAGRIVSHAKAEVEATFNKMVHHAGLEKLREELRAPTVPRLTTSITDAEIV